MCKGASSTASTGMRRAAWSTAPAGDSGFGGCSRRDGVRVPPILVFGYGNPSRGDDAAGPMLIERLEARERAGELEGVELLTDFQLQIEHALDLAERQLVVFVDAAASGPAPFALARLRAQRDASYTTHAMRPEAVLQVYKETTGEGAPPAWLLAIRGYSFDLGKPPTAAAAANLGVAEGQLLRFLRDPAGTAQRRGAR
jgi:hydrogenase maturation protease